MFSGNLILCDYLTKLHDGKFVLVGLYNEVIVQGPEKKHDFTFFSQITTDFRGPADARVRFFYDGEGPECIQPLVDISFSLRFDQNPLVPGRATSLAEFPFQVTQAHLQVTLDARIRGENISIPFVAILTIGEYEIARKSFVVRFILKPEVTVTRL